MEFLNKVGMTLATAGVVCAFIVPDWIAGVSKAMRMGREYYPKEQRIKKWKWIGIFAGVAAVGCVITLLTGGFH